MQVYVETVAWCLGPASFLHRPDFQIFLRSTVQVLFVFVRTG